jgi:putative phosphoesterase
MLIGITADTHSNGRPILRSIEEFNRRKVQMVLHCGDWEMPFTLMWYSELECPLKGVLGNGDQGLTRFLWAIQQQKLNLDLELDPHFLDLKLETKRIAVCHGDSNPLLEFLIECQQFDVLCLGHNHKPDIRRVGETLLINPGSLVGVKLPESRTYPYTIATYNTETDKAEIVEL